MSTERFRTSSHKYSDPNCYVGPEDVQKVRGSECTKAATIKYAAKTKSEKRHKEYGRYAYNK